MNSIQIFICYVFEVWWKKVIQRSREGHNHKSHPKPDTDRKRKTTKTNTYKTNKKKKQQKKKKKKKKKKNKCTRSTQTSSLLPKRGNHNAKRNDETQGQRAWQDFETWNTP